MSNCSVTVQVADHLGRLDIVDGSFRSVASGFDSVQAELPPGLYKARASINVAHSEELFTVEPSSDRLTLTLAPPRFTTPAPLQDTACTLDHQQQALTQATQRRPVDAHLGEGASLLLCVRDVSGEHRAASACDDESRAGYRQSFGEFTLHDHDGNHLLDVSKHAQPDIERGILIFHVAAHPGYYLLSIKTGEGEYIEMPLPACKGWRSGLYLQMRPPHCLEQTGHPDVMERALLFEPVEQAFDPARRDSRMTEMTRLALLRGRDVHLPEQLHAVLRKRVVNPGILLFGAHLLLAETHLDHGLLRNTIDHLAGVFGADFPDVVALRMELARINHATPVVPQTGVTLPPLLRASWRLLTAYSATDSSTNSSIDASTHSPPQSSPQSSFLAPGSLARRVGTQFMPSGPWLTWRVQEPPIRLDPFSRLAAGGPESMGLKFSYFMAPPLNTQLGGITGKPRSLHRQPPAQPAPVDEAQAALTASRQAAEIIGRLDLSQWKAGAAGRNIVNGLTRLQKALLPVLQLIEIQRTDGDDFTLDELKQLQQQLGVPLSVFRESMDDLLDKLQAQ
jgi:hypothetical protein